MTTRVRRRPAQARPAPSRDRHPSAVLLAMSSGLFTLSLTVSLLLLFAR